MARNWCLGTSGLVTLPPQSLSLPLPLSLSFSLKWSVPPVIYIILFWHLYFSHQSQYLLSVYLLSEHVSSLSGNAQKINFTVFSPAPLSSFFLSLWDTKLMKWQKQDNENNNASNFFFVLAGWISRYLFLTSLWAICLRKGLFCIFLKFCSKAYLGKLVGKLGVGSGERIIYLSEVRNEEC